MLAVSLSKFVNVTLLLKIFTLLQHDVASDNLIESTVILATSTDTCLIGLLEVVGVGRYHVIVFEEMRCKQGGIKAISLRISRKMLFSVE